MNNKLLFFTIFTGALAISADCQAMWRIRHVAPMQPKPAPKLRLPIGCEKIAQIKGQYPLPHAHAQYILNFTAPQLKAHLKYDELCHKVVMKAGDYEKTDYKLKNAAKKLVLVGVAPVAASIVVASFADQTSALLFATGFAGCSLFAGHNRFDDLRQSWRDYKKAQNKMKTAEQELADLVAEDKFKFKVPDDIQ